MASQIDFENIEDLSLRNDVDGIDGHKEDFDSVLVELIGKSKGGGDAPEAEIGQSGHEVGQAVEEPASVRDTVPEETAGDTEEKTTQNEQTLEHSRSTPAPLATTGTSNDTPEDQNSQTKISSQDGSVQSENRDILASQSGGEKSEEVESQHSCPTDEDLSRSSAIHSDLESLDASSLGDGDVPKASSDVHHFELGLPLPDLPCRGSNREDGCEYVPSSSSSSESSVSDTNCLSSYKHQVDHAIDELEHFGQRIIPLLRDSEHIMSTVHAVAEWTFNKAKTDERHSAFAQLMFLWITRIFIPVMDENIKLQTMEFSLGKVYPMTVARTMLWITLYKAIEFEDLAGPLDDAASGLWSLDDYNAEVFLSCHYAERCKDHAAIANAATSTAKVDDASTAANKKPMTKENESSQSESTSCPENLAREGEPTTEDAEDGGVTNSILKQTDEPCESSPKAPSNDISIVEKEGDVIVKEEESVPDETPPADFQKHTDDQASSKSDTPTLASVLDKMLDLLSNAFEESKLPSLLMTYLQAPSFTNPLCLSRNFHLSALLLDQCSNCIEAVQEAAEEHLGDLQVGVHAWLVRHEVQEATKAATDNTGKAPSASVNQVPDEITHPSDEELSSTAVQADVGGKPPEKKVPHEQQCPPHLIESIDVVESLTERMQYALLIELMQSFWENIEKEPPTKRKDVN